MYGFAFRVLMSPHLTNTHDDTAIELHMMQEGTTWACGTPITDDDRRNTASMRIMQNAFGNMSRREPVTVWRELEGIDDWYDTVEPAFNALDLDLGPEQKLSKRPFLDAIRATRYMCPAPSPATRVVQDIWRQRGAIPETVFDMNDLEDALDRGEHGELHEVYVDKTGELVEGYDLPEVPETAIDIPFYHQYVSGQTGAHAVLMAFLEDMQTLNAELSR